MRGLTQVERTVILLVYVVVLLGVNWALTGRPVPSTGPRSVWLFGALAWLVLGNLLLQPYFTKPADAAANALAGFIAVTAIPAEVLPSSLGIRVLSGVVCPLLFLFIIGVAITAILLKGSAREPIESPRAIARVATKACDFLGAPEVVFSLVFFVAILPLLTNVFHFVWLVLVWFLMVPMRSVERTWLFVKELRREYLDPLRGRAVASVEHIEHPNVVIARPLPGQSLSVGETLLIPQASGEASVGIVLAVTPTSEGELARIVLMPEAYALGDNAGVYGHLVYKANVNMLDEVDQQFAGTILARKEALVGIVAEGSNVNELSFDVLPTVSTLKEGGIVEVTIDEGPVLYQVINGFTREETTEQRDKEGLIRATARKVGRWDEVTYGFEPVKWVPDMNTPVFLIEEREDRFIPQSVGMIPQTSYGVQLDLNELVTHNTAILGILGVGKTYLAFELIERMGREAIKVMVLDITGEYARPEHLGQSEQNIESRERIAQALTATRDDVDNQDPDASGNWQEFREAFKQEALMFMASDENVWICDPAGFDVTGHATGRFKAQLVERTTTEITCLITEAVYEVARQEMTDRARLCLVFEEGHSLIPEWNSTSFEGDQRAATRTAKAILQGRKYGMGCLVISQRTANVIKSILNQCNTIFAMRMFDETGLGFLNNYIGADYADLLSSLEDRHAVVFGSACSARQPIMSKLNDRQDFLGSLEDV